MIAYDLRHALRALTRRPGLSIAILLILALGIGATTTIFSITSSVLLSAVPYKDGDRLVTMKTVAEGDGSIFPAGYLEIDAWRRQSRTLELISASSSFQQLNMTGGDQAERVGVSFVSPSYFDLLGIRPARGRTFEPQEDNRTSPLPVAVMSHGLWKRRFGGDPAMVGKSIQLQGLAFQIVGILPEGFRDIYPDIDLYVPVTISRLTHREGYVEDRLVRWLDVFARLKPGVTLEAAQEDMRGIARQLAADFPENNKGYTISVKPLRTHQFDFERMRQSIVTLLIGAVFVLLVGCANVTNLLLIRAVERRKEVALRLALGVSRLHLIRYFILEGALLSLAGAALGVGAAYFAVKMLGEFGTTAYNLPAFVHFSVDLRALVGAVLLSALITILIGVIPARKSLQVDLQEELQSEGKGHSQSAGTAFTRSFLVVSAIFFSVVLLVGAGLMIKSLGALIQSDPGYKVDHVLSARFELPSTQYKTEEPTYLVYKRMVEEAQRLPDVQEAGLWAPGMPGSSFYFKFIVPEGKSLEAPEDKVKVYEHRTSPGLLHKLGIPLLQGRELHRAGQRATPAGGRAQPLGGGGDLAESGPDRQAVLGGCAAERLGGGGRRGGRRRPARPHPAGPRLPPRRLLPAVPDAVAHRLDHPARARRRWRDGPAAEPPHAVDRARHSGLRHQDPGGPAARRGGRHPAQHLPADLLRRLGPGAGDHRDLLDPRLHRAPAELRDRHPHGPGRRPHDDPAALRLEGGGAPRHRLADGPRLLARLGQDDVDHPVQRQPLRPARLRRGAPGDRPLLAAGHRPPGRHGDAGRPCVALPQDLGVCAADKDLKDSKDSKDLSSLPSLLSLRSLLLP